MREREIKTFLRGSWESYPRPVLLLKISLAINIKWTQICKLNEDLVRSDMEFINGLAYFDTNILIY